ncbi:MAG: SDR family NAD(P)-dependent oxidoreductase [Dehalococcoidia bacterium]
MSSWGARLADGAMELLVLPSYSTFGYGARRRLFDWTDLSSYDLSGRVVVLTGGTSGIGLAAARMLAAQRATLLVLGRDQAKTDAVCEEIRRTTGNEAVTPLIADMGDLGAIDRAAQAVLQRHDRVDALLHNAGVLNSERLTSADGTELTVAVQVSGPFLLTVRLLPALLRSPAGRVVTMSSGGMYTATLNPGALEMDAASYHGPRQYARAKRAQVTLNEVWAERTAGTGLRFHAMHPGWVDTPGLTRDLPRFRRLTAPLLRSAEQGADTLVWLAADGGAPATSSGRFWLDRRPRGIHRTRSTRVSDTPARRGELWRWCCERVGWADGLLTLP